MTATKIALQQKIDSRITEMRHKIDQIQSDADSYQLEEEEDYDYLRSQKELTSKLQERVKMLEKARARLARSKRVGKMFIIETPRGQDTITIVPPPMANSRDKLVSVESPLARNLLKNKPGNSFTLKTPYGSWRYKILSKIES